MPLSRLAPLLEPLLVEGINHLLGNRRQALARDLKQGNSVETHRNCRQQDVLEPHGSNATAREYLHHLLPNGTVRLKALDEQHVRLQFARRGRAHYTQTSAEEHGRIETRRIWCTSRLNDDLDFPYVGQVFLIEREVIVRKSGDQRCEVALGVTSRMPGQAAPADLLRINRGHWSIENSCHHVLDMTWDEDRCLIRTGHGPENTSRLRRFAISVLNLHAKPGDSIASMTRRLAAKTRLVFDYLLMTTNSTGHAPAS